MTRCHSVAPSFICISCQMLCLPMFRAQCGRCFCVSALCVSINKILWVTLVPSRALPLCLSVYLHINVHTAAVYGSIFILWLCPTSLHSRLLFRDQSRERLPFVSHESYGSVKVSCSHYYNKHLINKRLFVQIRLVFSLRVKLRI